MKREIVRHTYRGGNEKERGKEIVIELECGKKEGVQWVGEIEVGGRQR